MKSALKKQYQQKLIEMNDNNNPSIAYGKENGFLYQDDDDDEDDDETPHKKKTVTKKIPKEKTNKSCCILFQLIFNART